MASTHSSGRAVVCVHCLDHIGLHAASLEEFDEIRSRLMAAGATDGTVTDFGRKLSLFLRDPDGMECEVLVSNPEPGRVSIGSASHLNR